MRNKLAKKIKKQLTHQLYHADLKTEDFKANRTSKGIYSRRSMIKEIYQNNEFKSINRAKRKNIKRHSQVAPIKRSRRQQRLAKWRLSQWD